MKTEGNSQANKSCCMVFGVLFLLALDCVWTAGAQAASNVEVMAVVPQRAFIGSQIRIPITTVDVKGAPVVALVGVKFGNPHGFMSYVAQGLTDETGRFIAEFDVPPVDPGTYEIQVEVAGSPEVLTGSIVIQEMPVLLIETDKPIYKPGQQIRARVLVLDPALRPVGEVEVEVQITDGKGVKIHKEQLSTNAFGIAPFDLALASELNLGTWKITAESGSATGQVDIRVERYVLPRFDVDTKWERDYFLAEEPISGTVSANYFFGQPVEGSLEVRASRYVGQWEEYARYKVEGFTEQAGFTIDVPADRYYGVGTLSSGGAVTVQLDITVTDSSGHEEKTTQLVKIVDSRIQHQVIPTYRSIAPGYPITLTLVAETPNGEPMTVEGELHYRFCQYCEIAYQPIPIPRFTGQTTMTINVPKDAEVLWVNSHVWNDRDRAETQHTVYRNSYSSDSFIHITTAREQAYTVGDHATVQVVQSGNSTVYYDVFAQGHTVYSGYSLSNTIEIPVTTMMAPFARVVAYVINPNNEISADSCEFEVIFESAVDLAVGFDVNEAEPGQSVQFSIQAGSEAMVGISIVDESVYALNEGRLNMQQVMNELERLYMEPQQETHGDPVEPWGRPWGFPMPEGATDIFKKAGLQILRTKGLQVTGQDDVFWEAIFWNFVDGPIADVPRGNASKGAELVEVDRIRQFFPETWFWDANLPTDIHGQAILDLNVPDSITTWRVHAVSTSEQGLGIGESSLVVFQEFFGEPDLPEAVTRGERFPIRIQIFNYLDREQLVHVTLTDSDWFDLLDPPVQQVLMPANTVGSASFEIEPRQLGTHTVEVKLQTTQAADAVRKPLRVEAEGTQREIAENGMIEAGQSVTFEPNIPDFAVPGSDILLLSVTPSLVAQSISGLDDLLHMPYGCGEQNMIFFAPDVEVLRFLDATGQLTPEVRAKAEHFITLGYQRELTFRHKDGSFSAFGERDESGSLWLTAFVLGSFSAARDIQTIDGLVLSEAAAWIARHQLPDGSWEPVGFVCHQEMTGGVTGTYSLTAFVLNALLDYGSADPVIVQKATQYLSDHVGDVQTDPYALAVAAAVFARLPHAIATFQTIMDHLWELAIRDERGIHWEPHAVETTSYVALAMIESDNPSVNEVLEWIALQSNAKGGFGHTQDTVMALKALMTAARAQTRDTDLTLTVRRPEGTVVSTLELNATNFDVLQTVVLPTDAPLTLSAAGSGKTRYQWVRRFNVLLDGGHHQHNDMTLEVHYDANHIAVDDIVDVHVTVRYLGRKESTGMMIVDVGVPTGFSTVQESLDTLLAASEVSRIEQAGRKVIFYVDEMKAGEERRFLFQVKARWPVRAVVPDSQVYLYYDPDVRAEAQGEAIVVGSE